MVLGLLSFPAWGADNAGMSSDDHVILAGWGPGDGTGEGDGTGGHGPGDCEITDGSNLTILSHNGHGPGDGTGEGDGTGGHGPGEC